jgi:aspartate carbamoyltransferase catalytic subunit
LPDLYTIYRERPLNGLSVAFIGERDRGRTARSLAYLLAKFDRVKIFFVAPPEMQMKPDILEYLDRHHVRYELESDIGRVVDSTVLRRMRSDAMILHLLPRTVELDKTVDDDPRALYFRRAKNGLYVRMAFLAMLLDQN